jgi:hypothetical protein
MWSVAWTLARNPPSAGSRRRVTPGEHWRKTRGIGRHHRAGRHDAHDGEAFFLAGIVASARDSNEKIWEIMRNGAVGAHGLFSGEHGEEQDASDSPR